jgi:hypothetical protein
VVRTVEFISMAVFSCRASVFASDADKENFKNNLDKRKPLIIRGFLFGVRF